jgi:hypothetical protein
MSNLTIIITTSAIQSHPDTHTIDQVIASIQFEFHEIIIVCDGVSKLNEKYESNYNKYLECLKRKYPSFRIFIRDKHYGFGHNLYWTLQQIQSTFVFVAQHDQMIIQQIPMDKMIETMEKNREIRYIGLASPTNCNEAKTRWKLPQFSNLMNELCNHYKVPQPFNETDLTHFLLYKSNRKYGLPLFPLLTFYDRPHLMRRVDYLYYFKSGRIRTFPESSLGIEQENDICTKGWNEFLQNYGSYLLYMNYPDNVSTIHLNGRSKITESERVQRIQSGMEINAMRADAKNSCLDNVTYFDASLFS